MKYLMTLALLFSFVGCEKDPYPSIGERVKEPSPPPREREDVKVPPATSADFPKFIEYKEGVKKVYKLKLKVPAPGVPIVTIDNLPAGATFDEDNLSIVWRPGFFDGNDPQDPTIKKRSYLITVWLRSSEDEVSQAIKEVISLNVIDVQQQFDIKASDYKTVSEGNTLSYEFEIESLDYPNGPFKVFTEKMPANTRVEKITDKKYKLVFSPDYQHVKLNDNVNPCDSYGKDCLKYSPVITVNDPANHETSKSIEIRVQDVRQTINLVTPDTMQQGLDISFGISSVDPNGEVAPDLSISSGRPASGLGQFTTSTVSDEDNNLSVLNVSWKDIPISMNGKSHYFSFKSCVLDKHGNKDSCDYKSFNVNIVVKDRNPPVFSRSDWPQGDIKYFKYDESKTYTITVRDGDQAINVDNVEVKPKSMQKHVSFYNNRLTVKIDQPGIHSFSLVATSEYNVSSAESFMFEVFKEDRFKTIYFTDSTRNDEVKFYRDTMGDVQLLNPVLNSISDRVLSGRENLIIGTDILKDLSMRADIEKAMGLIDNVVVASSLLENMPAKFLTELQDDFRVSIMGRYSDISNAPALKEMYFIARDDFETSYSKIGLKLNSTTESYDPLIFSIGVDRKNCQDVMDFTNKGASQGSSLFKIGIICDRKFNRGRVAILGTEFSDLKTTEADKQIPARWLRKMLTTDLSNKQGEK